MQTSLLPRLQELKELLQVLLRPYLIVYELQGQAQGGWLTAIFAGRAQTRARWKSLLFVQEPSEQPVGRVPFWSLHSLADAPGDLIVIEATRSLINRLPGHNALVLPRVVDQVVDTCGDWQGVQARFHKNLRHDDIRRIRKYGYMHDISHCQEDLTQFYHGMYRPTMLARHTEMALLTPLDEACQYFRHGCLLRITRNGEWVAGAVCYPRRGELIGELLGVKNADEQLIREGAMSAVIYAALQWAHAEGFKAVNLLGNIPFMNSGSFQYKRRWGARVAIPTSFHTRLWIKLGRATPAVMRFLIDRPCITTDRDGRLHGLVFVDRPEDISAETEQEWQKCYTSPGLDSLRVRSAHDFSLICERTFNAGPD